MWAMYYVKSGFNDNFVGDFGNVLKRMCQTDPVLSTFLMGRTKLQYVINYGLFSHFKQMILNEILNSPLMSVLYDESLNDSIQKSEMEILNDIGMRVKTRSLCGTGHLCFLVILDVITSLKHFIMDLMN